MADKKKKVTYWEGRSIKQDIRLHDNLNKIEPKILVAYKKAQEYISEEVSKLYRRFLTKSGKSEQEVKQILNTTAKPEEIAKLQELVQTIEDKTIKKQVQDYLTGLVVKSRISRLEHLKAKAYIVAKQLADVQQVTMTGFFIDSIHEAYNVASAEAVIGKTDAKIRKIPIYDWKTGKNININQSNSLEPVYKTESEKFKVDIVDKNANKVVHTIDLTNDKPIHEFKELSTKYVENILESRWKGENYSERIWGDTDALAKRLEELFTVEAVTGMSEFEMAKAIAQEFQTGIFVAKRLIRTEANYVMNKTKIKAWQEHGVEEYKIVVTLDLRTSKICRDISVEDKVYKVKDAVLGTNVPPLHPFCRSVVIAWFGKDKLRGNKTAIDPVTGKAFTLKMTDTYKEWEKYLIDKHGVKNLEEMKKKIKNKSADLTQYNKYKTILGEGYAPETFDKFQEIKYTGGRDFRLLALDYKRRIRLLKDKSLSLPGAKNAIIDSRKFTHYLFGGENKNGLIKGQNIEKRLGYNFDNYPEFQKAILKAANDYPATVKRENQYGTTYEQKIILYNKNRQPSNLVVGWQYKDGRTHLASIYIKEVK